MNLLRYVVAAGALIGFSCCGSTPKLVMHCPNNAVVETELESQPVPILIPDECTAPLFEVK